MSYDNFCIYKIYHKDHPDNFYIGSTTNFPNRKASHKKNVYNKVSKKFHYPIYKYIRSLGGWDNFVIEVYKNHPCKTKEEALQYEQDIIDNLKPSLNMIKAHRKNRPK